MMLLSKPDFSIFYMPALKQLVKILFASGLLIGTCIPYATSATSTASTASTSTSANDDDGQILDDGTPTYTTQKTAQGEAVTKTTKEDGGFISETQKGSQYNNQQPFNSRARYKAGAPGVYTVKSGDTLWGIAGKYLDNPWRWKEIWVENQQIKNPNLIYPNQRLLMCDTDSGKRVGVDEGDGCQGVQRRAKGIMAGARVIIEKLAPFIPMIATAEIESWLTDVKIVSTNEYLQAPYIIASKNRHLMMSTGDTIYVRNKGLKIGDSYGIYRKGERYLDPVTRDLLGNEARMIGVARVEGIEGEVATLTINQNMDKEILAGDRLFPLEAPDLPPIFYPASPVDTPNGQIIKVLDSVGTASLNSIVVINRGLKQNVKPGDIFIMYRKGEKVRDSIADEYLRMPYEKAGAALVFRTFENLSYALIMDASTEVKVGDQVRAPNALD